MIFFQLNKVCAEYETVNIQVKLKLSDFDDFLICNGSMILNNFFLYV